MDGVVVAAIASSASAIAASWSAWMIQRYRNQAAMRKASGGVKTTDADELWRRLIAELDRREIRINGLEATEVKIMGELRERDQAIHELSLQIASLMSELTERDERIRKLEGERDLLRARVDVLESELRGRLELAARSAVGPPPSISGGAL